MSEPSLIYLTLGFHDHQPTGNFPHVFEKHYLEAYLPFLDVMEPHRDVPFSLHMTGPLLLWLAQHHPEFMARVRRLCVSGRVEMKGGGFYEPILAAIPDQDKREQLERMSRYLAEELGAAPEGAWIAERVWEPHLARHLAQAGLAYATLDDSHFLNAGLDRGDTFGYYLTEEEGWRFDLFPISQELRYLIPFQEPEATIAYLRDVEADWRARRRSGDLPPEAPPPVAVYDDDGEKFGGWPGTHQHVYDAGWLERFLRVLHREMEAGWLRVATPGGFRRSYGPLGRIYLPTASYAEMLEWSGGFYRNFLVRYPEANLLHKRMLHTSLETLRRLAVADESTPAPAEEAADGGASVEVEPDAGRRVEKRALLAAHDHVLRAQCNDAYWHGVFGGIYLPHLRHAVHADLIEAERCLGSRSRPPVEVVDVDIDGADEVFLRTADLTVLVHPARGGALVGLDHLPTSFALLDTLRRRREPEHRVLEELAASRNSGAGPEGAETPGSAPDGGDPDHPGPAHSIHDLVRMKEPGLEDLLFVDRHPRHAFLDHFYAVDTTVQRLVAAEAEDLGDFAQGAYEMIRVDATPGAPAVDLSRVGDVAGTAVSVRKSISVVDGLPGGSRVTVDYRIEVSGTGTPTHHPTALFAPEVDLTMLAGWAHDRYVLVDDRPTTAPYLADEGTHPGARSVTLVDDSRGLSARLSWTVEGDEGPGTPGPQRPPAADITLLRHGVVTVSLSEDGFERIYQCTALVPCFPLRLEPGSTCRLTLRLDVVGS